MIEFSQLSKNFGAVHAVRDFNLTVRKGESFALLGPNGGGKSTILRALVGLHKPSSGTITIDGVDVTSKGFHKQNLIAYMPQRMTAPDHLTGREVLELFAKVRSVPDSRVDAMLDFVRLTDDANRRTTEYSGGMLQRLGLAITFLEDVPILVLDEPTLNLDSLGIELFRSKIRELKQNGTTLIFSSHLLEDAAQLADRVAVIVAGELVKVEDVPTFRERISYETSVRVILEEVSDNIKSAVNATGALTTAVNGRQMIFKAPPSKRLDVIRAIEGAGGHVREFHTEAPSWESLVHESFAKNGDEQ